MRGDGWLAFSWPFALGTWRVEKQKKLTSVCVGNGSSGKACWRCLGLTDSRRDVEGE